MVETFAIASVVAVAVYFMLIFLRALLKETHTRHVRSSAASLPPASFLPFASITPNRGRWPPKRYSRFSSPEVSICSLHNRLPFNSVTYDLFRQCRK